MKPGKNPVESINPIRLYQLILLVFCVFALGKTGFGQSVSKLETILVNLDQPYPLLGFSRMLRTEKGVDVHDVLSNQSRFKPFSNSNIEIDIAGKYDYWFLFNVSSEIAPLYLTLPLIQNFDIELFRVDSVGPVLLSKGGILTPANQKYLNFETELFDLKTLPGQNNTYLLKINRTPYKTFSARIFTARALIKQNHQNFILEGILLGIILCVVLYHLLIFIRVREKEYLLLALYMFFLLLQITTLTGLFNSVVAFDNTQWNHVLFNFIPSFSAFFSFWFSYVFLNISNSSHRITFKVFRVFQGIFVLSAFFALLSVPVLERLTILVSGFASVFLFAIGIVRLRENFKPASVYLIAYVPTFFSIPFLLIYVSGKLPYSWFTHNNLLISIAFQAILFSLAIAAKIRILKTENEALLWEENLRLEEMVRERTSELRLEKEKVENTLNELKSTQSQLIQAEKMASLGELTAGIAHEIQNPLNFVNNFSEINNELIDELQDERKKKVRDLRNEDELINTIKENEQKINHHGKRADAIVKGMLQHSRSSNGVKEPTNINTLADEYFRLAYHGLRAKDKSFNATLKTDFDESIKKIDIIPQDIGRVILNLVNNAFYAVHEKKIQLGTTYEPIVSVITRQTNSNVELLVTDNGNGIPQKALDKIYQPFFTTKPAGQGTGLGLSMSYDIVKVHGGELKVETKDGEGTIFSIVLPVNAL
jgi:two-component system, NtrC family, sensor kinase